MSGFARVSSSRRWSGRVRNEKARIGVSVGVALAGGIPALVLVSLGPIAGLAGPVAVAVWALAALIGALMTVCFAELVGLRPRQSGGIAVAAACVLRPHNPLLGRMCQWSYWLGWVLAIGINGSLIGTYVQKLSAPGGPAWVAVLGALAVLVACTALQTRGLSMTTLMQVALGACALIPVIALVAIAPTNAAFSLDRLSPFVPPHGWGSISGLLGVAGALFVAGWAAYGAEVSLAYAGDYDLGARSAVKAVFILAVTCIAAFTLVPLTLAATIGSVPLNGSPDAAWTSLATRVAGHAEGAVMPLVLVALILTSNTLLLATSKVLAQMGANGSAWPCLGRLNARGVPRNALFFALSVNACVVVASFALNGWQSAQVPLALVITANVGYFVSIILAMVAVCVARRYWPDLPRTFTAPRPFFAIGVACAVLNTVILAAAGFSLGWENIALGSALVLVVTVLGAPSTEKKLAGAFRWEPIDRALLALRGSSDPPPPLLANLLWGIYTHEPSGIPSVPPPARR